MNIRHLFLATALILASGGAEAQPARSRENWIGAWGFAVVPPPPGIAMPVTAPALVPLAPAPAAATPAAPLVENPGGVPIATLTNDPSNLTIRQLARVSAAGKRIRLRFTNESGSDVLNLGAVHVGLAGPDGSVVAGSDRVVTFDGMRAVAIPAGAPLISDPVDL